MGMIATSPQEMFVLVLFAILVVSCVVVGIDNLEGRKDTPEKESRRQIITELRDIEANRPQNIVDRSRPRCRHRAGEYEATNNEGEARWNNDQ